MPHRESLGRRLLPGTWDQGCPMSCEERPCQLEGLLGKGLPKHLPTPPGGLTSQCTQGDSVLQLDKVQSFTSLWERSAVP